MENQEVVVYISENNTYCNKVIKLIEEQDISYKIKNITKNTDYRKELQNEGIYGTPALFIKGQERTILGYQKNRILRALNDLTN